MLHTYFRIHNSSYLSLIIFLYYYFHRYIHQASQIQNTINKQNEIILKRQLQTTREISSAIDDSLPFTASVALQIETSKRILCHNINFDVETQQESTERTAKIRKTGGIYVNIGIDICDDKDEDENKRRSDHEDKHAENDINEDGIVYIDDKGNNKVEPDQDIFTSYNSIDSLNKCNIDDFISLPNIPEIATIPSLQFFPCNYCRSYPEFHSTCLRYQSISFDEKRTYFTLALPVRIHIRLFPYFFYCLRYNVPDDSLVYHYNPYILLPHWVRLRFLILLTKLERIIVNIYVRIIQVY